MTPEQQRAIAIASARARLSGEDFAAIKADGAQGGAPMPMSPEALSSMTSQISPYLPTERGTDVAGEIAQVPYNVGAAVNDKAAQYLPAPFAAGLGAAANAGLEGAQMVAGGGIGGTVGTGAKEAAQGTGRWLMGKAIRPQAADRLNGKFERARETMLEMGYSPTIGGTDAMAVRAAKNDALAKELIKNSTGTVNKQEIGDSVLPVLNSVMDSPLPRNGMETVSRAREEFMTHPKLPSVIPAQTIPAQTVESQVLNASGKPFTRTIPEQIIPQSGTNEIPVQLAQALKQRAYKEMGDAAYGIGLKPAAERDSLKAMAAKLREKIEVVVPEVAPINAETSALLNAKKVAQRRAFVEANNNPVSLGTTIAAATNNPLLAIGMWANASSAAKAAMARALYTGGKAGPALGTVAGAGAVPFMQDEPK